MRNLKKTYKFAQKIFPDISGCCARCNTCCQTYGWLLRAEAKYFSKKGFPLVQINNCLYCLDSFERNINGERILDKIPSCVFYRNQRCAINEDKPLDCRLYPVKIKFLKNDAYIGISLGCKYIFSLNEKEKSQIYRSVIDFFKKAPPKVINEYLNIAYQINLISKPKKFWLKKLIRINKRGQSWEMEVLIDKYK